MPPEVNIEELESDLAKGNLLGEEAEAAQKLIDEANTEKEAEEAAKKAEEDELAKGNLTDEEKAAAEAKEAEEAKLKEEEEAKAAYEKLSDEEKAEHDKKVEEEAAAAKEAERAAKNKGIKVPKFRLDAATARARKAEQEADDLRLKLAEAEADKAKPSKDALSPADAHEAKLADLDAKIAEALKEGQSEEVAKLMKESRLAERNFQTEQSTARITESSQTTTAQMQESNLITSILDQLEEQYPMFDESSDQFNEAANADVLKVQRGLIATGESAADALVEAVNLVLPKYGVVEEIKDEVKDEKKPADKSKDVKRNIDAAKKTPPDMENAGEDSDKAGAESDLPNAADLTEAEYDALPEATLKRMRGDIF